LYVTELLDTYARVRMFRPDGSFVGEVPLPGRGAVAEMPFPLMEHFAKRPSEAFVFAFSSLTESWGIYSHRPGDACTETLIPSDVRIEHAVVEDRWAHSVRGVRVPYHVVRRADVDMSRPQPTLLFAYGSGGAAVNPQFPGAMAAFVAAGGIFVHAHPRGGGELGLEWWHGGVLKNRQNSYADMYAVAEDLIARGVTNPKCLALTGRSAGGLMVGVAVTQRPDLWRVAIPQVPVLDVIGGAREPYLGYVASLEFGDFDDPEDVRRMGTFSPYHLVRDGVEYPAVYIDAGDTDPRCPAWHARKFAARLQEAQAGSAPILLHVWQNSGHGWATSKDVQIEEYTEWLAFAMRELGMKPQAVACEVSEWITGCR
jgi:prolyl oligopeptidase